MRTMTASLGARSPPQGLAFRSLLPFFGWTFGVSWGVGVVFVLFSAQVEAVFGPMGYTNPVFVLMVYSPAIVGITMVWRRNGLTGLGSFLRRFTLWRMAARWWLVLLVGIPAVYLAGAALTGGLAATFPFSPWYLVLPALLPMLLIGPMEEIGWRGVALPLLQRRFAPLWSALILGVTMAVWHTPSFLMSGTKQSAWEYWPFFFGLIAVGVILTAMFNASRGSLLVAFLFHAQLNNPIWPDAQPWDMWIFVAAAVVIALLNRKAMLGRGRAVTQVLMPVTTEGEALVSARAVPLHADPTSLGGSR